jgi:hypothetical protein
MAFLNTVASMVPQPMQRKPLGGGLQPQQPTPVPVQNQQQGGIVPEGPGMVPPGMQPAAQTSFGPQNNLIGSQFSPNPSQRLQTAQGYASTAAGNLAGQQPLQYKALGAANTGQSQNWLEQAAKFAGQGSQFTPGGGGMPAQLSGGINDLLSKIMSGPDRAKLAGDTYSTLEERARPGYEQRLRSVGQKAAALGRVKAGLTSIHNRDLDLSRRELAAGAAGQTLDDQLKALQAARGVGNDYSSASLGASNAASNANQQAFENYLRLSNQGYGRERDTYGDQLGERAYGDDLSERNFGRSRQALGDLSAYEQQLTGNERNDRDELRGERGYQYGLERDALGDRIGQYGLERDVLGQERDWTRQLTGIGYGQNPTDAYQNYANQQGQQAQGAMDAAGQLFGEWAKSRQRRVQPTTTPRDSAVDPYGV